MPEPLILGNRSMDSGRRPLCGCFVLSCVVGGIFRKPLDFRRCLPPARPEKAKPFQAGRSPCTKHLRLSGFAFMPPKSFWGFQGAFFQKRALGRVWDSVPQREGKPVSEVRLFRRDKVLSRNTDRPSGFAFTPQKSFWGFQGAVFQKRALGKVWDGVPQGKG